MERHDIIKKTKAKEWLVCYGLYKFFVYMGNNLYKASEFCVLRSKDRERKLALDASYDKKMNVGTLVVENEKVCDEVLEHKGIDISCEEAVEKLGEVHVDTKKELVFCRDIVYSLWQAHCDNDRKKADEIFKSLGLKNKKEM